MHTTDQDFLSEVRSLMEIADYTAALNLLDNAEKTGRWCPQFFLERAICLINLKRDKDSLVDLDSFLSINPQHSRTFNRRGLVYSYLGRHQEALLDQTEAVNLCPKNISFLLDLADEHQKLGHDQAYLDLLSTVLEIDPDHTLARDLRGEHLIATIDPETGYLDYLYLSKKHPNNADYHFCQARCLAMMNKTTEALAEVDIALRLEPDNSFFKEGRVNILRDAEDDR